MLLKSYVTQNWKKLKIVLKRRVFTLSSILLIIGACLLCLNDDQVEVDLILDELLKNNWQEIQKLSCTTHKLPTKQFYEIRLADRNLEFYIDRGAKYYAHEEQVKNSSSLSTFNSEQECFPIPSPHQIIKIN